MFITCTYYTSSKMQWNSISARVCCIEIQMQTSDQEISSLAGFYYVTLRRGCTLLRLRPREQLLLQNYKA